MYEADADDWTRIEWTRNGIINTRIFKKVPKFLRAIRRKSLTNFCLRLLWYSDWFKSIKEYDVIIIHISSLTKHLPEDINKLNPNARIIVWYWNTVKEAIKPENIKGIFESWSFDEKDCREYNMYFNHQYFFKSIHFKNLDIENDIYFCGRDAGRSTILLDLYNQCKHLKLKIVIKIIDPISDDIPKELCSNYLPYSEIITDISKSRCLLEIVRSGQVGPTVRTMEAIYAQKKLITNNKSIISEPFYNPNNIFVLDGSNCKDIPSFLDGKFEEYSSELKDQLDVSNWITNFIQKGGSPVTTKISIC